MKKVKVLLVGILTLVLSLFCLVGCFEQGKYEAVSYSLGSLSVEVDEDDDSYVELKGDDVAVVSISVGTLTWEGEGTCTKGEEKGTVVITISGIEHTATIDGSTMTLDLGIGSIKLEK